MIERAPFGATGHESSRVIFGAAALGDVSKADADRTLELLLEHGINHIDVAATYGDADLRIATYVVDLASTIGAIEEMRGEPSRLLADGSDIQLYVADRHGAQRADLGCSIEALRREWEIVKEEITTVVRGIPVGEAAIAEAIGVLGRFIESGRIASERALLRARAELRESP